MKQNATKNALSEALILSLQKKPLSRITINDITTQCGISRMTFYYHFSDIYDLVEWTLQEALKDVLADHHDMQSWQQGFLNLLTVMKDQRSLLLNVYRSTEREMVERYMLRETQKLLLNVVNEESAGLRISPDGQQWVSSFYSYAFMGVVLQWIQHGMKETPQEIVARTAAVIQGDFRNSLENMSKFELRKR